MKNFMIGLTTLVTILTIVIASQYNFKEKTTSFEFLNQQYVNQNFVKGSKVDKNL